MTAAWDMLGAYELADVTRNELVSLARSEGELQTGTEEFGQKGGANVAVHRGHHRVPIRIKRED